ncbi:23S rRNA (guanosine(2251)-2'-O)-methyltransferase RlmB [Thermodesulforhabdus norvegica]|uniref:23S rRNA (Guanosine2251-2'-O)-methyltransferase n=1 Tax=Thermodesulforhabdus norvegica TaxID=39841 RepID=A0A1I4SCH7_9BACT|nr:23S rRNA (guanosine(2251)-2'-O)-methyltransferase RlmB [Thermodesulforhabdus norvegica]SFM62034.1 23S rRNA (guanosine2251-2'-O)-methyltransferase [Thermodesulforhabdus norvegica]
MKYLWISGIHPVEEALKLNPEAVVEVLVAREGSVIEAIVEDSRRLNIPVKKVSPQSLHKITGYKNHQGVAARLESFHYTDLDDFLERVPEKPGLLILDCIQDPQNFGSILRSAAFFGINGIVLPEYRSVSVTPAVAKVAAGALGRVPVIRVKNLSRAVTALKEKEILVIGLDAHTECSIYDLDLTVGVAFVIGNEHSGLRRKTRESCDTLATIPRGGPMESLNAAVSAAVACAELRRQRLISGRTGVLQK